VCAEIRAPGWLESVLDPRRCVIFLDTDGIGAGAALEEGLRPGDERECTSSVTNPVEARLVCQLVSAMVLCGTPHSALAVISPLRSQLKLIRETMAHIRRVEVNTVDKFQVGGRVGGGECD
jgi:DNA replication ATP-dependent helicase Dna2